MDNPFSGDRRRDLDQAGFHATEIYNALQFFIQSVKNRAATSPCRAFDDALDDIVGAAQDFCDDNITPVANHIDDAINEIEAAETLKHEKQERGR